MVLVDTTVWIDYLADKSTPETEWLETHLSEEPLGLTDLIVCEILQGVRRDQDFRLIQQRLFEFSIFDTGGKELAIDAAQNYRLLRSRGFTVRRTIDCVIATFCIREGHKLLHRDRDFDAFEQHLGLLVVHPRTSIQ